MKINNSKEIELACCNLLLAVAEADEIIEDNELDAIQAILSDFLDISSEKANQIMDQSLQQRKRDTGLFNVGKILNEKFDLDMKLDLLHCIYEVGYADGSLHHLEDFIIKRIANILHIEHSDLVNARIEVRKWFEND